jgi:hypothetical protein
MSLFLLVNYEFDEKSQLSKSVRVRKQGLAKELAPAGSICGGPHLDNN